MSDKEIIRYAFLSDFVKESSEEDIINKLIELDDKLKEKNNKIKQLESVIDKAIKFIENNSPNLSNAEVYYLLEILRSKE